MYYHLIMLLQEWITQNQGALSFNELVYLTKGVLSMEEIDFLSEISCVAQMCLDRSLRRRCNGEPLSKIIELKEFWKYKFKTTNTTLDPRPETEFLIEHIGFKPRSILELGVGTGCVLLSVLKEFPKAKGLGIDVCENALSVAKENAVFLNLEHRARFLRNDWANCLSGEYDLVISNPPYVNKALELSPETLSDPDIALFGDLNTYKNLILSLKNITFKRLLLEVPNYLLDEVRAFLVGLYNGYIVECFDIYGSGIYCVTVRSSV